MDREQEEAVLRITAQYVEEVQAGHQPKVSDYIARYPQYADELTDFAAYYHAFEKDIPTTAQPGYELADDFHIAMNYAWERIAQADTSSPKGIATLLLTANKRRLTLSRLAEKLGLSKDIVKKLEQRKITALSIPAALTRRLADVVQQPVDVIEVYFASSDEHLSQKQHVAEAQTFYQVHQAPSTPAQSFYEAVEGSTELSEEQKSAWRKILVDEGLV